MTNKEKTIKAFKELIERYMRPIGQSFGHWDTCPLCEIFHVRRRKLSRSRKSTIKDCQGCPLADKNGEMGCINFESYPHVDADSKFTPFSIKQLEALERRAKFFEKYLPIIEKMPARKFTISGWSYFKFDLRD